MNRVRYKSYCFPVYFESFTLFLFSSRFLKICNISVYLSHFCILSPHTLPPQHKTTQDTTLSYFDNTRSPLNMQFSTLILSAAVASFTYAQSAAILEQQAKIPVCGVTCLTTAAGAAGCDITDYACKSHSSHPPSLPHPHPHPHTPLS